jgi:hypothetical protein
MALSEQAISIPLLAMDQKAGETAGPAGRLQRLVNGVVTKFSPDGSNLSIAKRPGFRVLPRTNGNPYSGGHSGTSGVPSPTVIDSLHRQLFAIGSDSAPYVFSAASQAWQKFSEETILTNTVSTSSVWAQSTQIKCPDAATADSTHCYVWSQGGQCFAMILDDDGTVIRAASALATGGRIKVVTDGTYFFVFYDSGTTAVTVTAFGLTGVQVAPATATTLYHAGDNWDVVYQADTGVCLARRGCVASAAVGITIASVSCNGSSITVTSHDNNAGQWFSGPSTTDPGGAFLLNKTGDGNLYLGTIVLGDGFTLYVTKLNTSATIAHAYQPIQSGLDGHGITNIAGYFDGTNVHAAVAHVPYTGSTPLDNFASNAFTEFGYSTATLDAQGYFVKRSVGLASRYFYEGSIPLVWTYYASVPTENDQFFVQSGQPTYFLLRADTGAVVGRALHQTAAADWQWSSWNGTDLPAPNTFQLPTPRSTTKGLTVSLGQTGAQQVQATTTGGGFFELNKFVTSVGVTDLTLGAPGTCVELDHETLIPGPLPRSFDGVSFSASGVELSPEEPAIADSSTSGGLNGNESYSYVIVYERLDRAGRKVRSGSSIATTYVVPTGLTNRSAALTIPTLRVTSHDDTIISVYRTVWANSEEGVTHHKVTNDLSPLLNDPTVDTVAFVDSASNESASQGEVLYGGSGAIPASEGGGDGQEVDHDPPPPFGQGAVFQDRCFLVGPDSTVSFSLPGSPSSPFTFDDGLFTMTVPTHDEIKAVAALDGRLIFLCDESLWFVNQDTFLDATGAGDIPTPQQLPVTHGCTGVAAVIPDGCVYAASSGGFWLLGRDLSSTYIGAPVEDELDGAEIISIATDQNNRVYFLTDQDKILVFDVPSQCWFIWVTPTPATIISVWNGQLVYSDGTDIFVLTDGTYADNPGGVDQPIITQVEIEPISFADVQMFWDLDVFVVGSGRYSLTPTLYYDLDTSEPDVFPTIDSAEMDVDGSGRARYNIPITQPECTYMALTLVDSYPNGPGPGFTIEKLVAAVGVIPGKRRNNLNQRIQGA